jgi:hypothetical protein
MVFMKNEKFFSQSEKYFCFCLIAFRDCDVLTLVAKSVQDNAKIMAEM